MITEQDIEAARTAVEDAARAVALAELRGPEAWGTARAGHDHAVVRLERLVRGHAGQQAAEAKRAATEADPKTRKLLDRMAAELASSAEQASGKLAAAQAALVDALDAATAYDRAVGRNAAVLAELGLVAEDGAGRVNGAHRSGVVVGGQWWLYPKAHQLLTFLVDRVANARLGDRRFVARPHHSNAPLVDRVPPPAPAADLPRLRYESAEVEGAPVFLAHGEEKPAGSTRHYSYDEWRAMEREQHQAAIARGNELAIRQAQRR